MENTLREHRPIEDQEIEQAIQWLEDTGIGRIPMHNLQAMLRELLELRNPKFEIEWIKHPEGSFEPLRNVSCKFQTAMVTMRVSSLEFPMDDKKRKFIEDQIKLACLRQLGGLL